MGGAWQGRHALRSDGRCPPIAMGRLVYWLIPEQVMIILHGVLWEEQCMIRGKPAVTIWLS